MVTFSKPSRKVHTTWLHCSASSAKSADNVEEIRRWHLARGWSDVGYHYFIKRNGTIQKGRPINRIPAAQRGHNTGSIAICLHGAGGNPPKNDFTKAQFTSLKKLCMQINTAYNGKMKFRGHREVAAKACPVFDYKKALKLDSNKQMSLTSAPPPPTEVNEPPSPVSKPSFWTQLFELIANLFRRGT